MNRHRLLRWLRRCAPPEVAATAGALLGALVGARLAGGVGGAAGGDVGEALAFCVVVVAQELRAERGTTGPRPLRRLLLDLLAEFGPVEAVDSLVFRPLAMYAGPFVTGDLLTGTIVGKVAADLIFYAIAAAGYERRRSHRAAVDPLAPEVLDEAPHRTPYLVMDLDRVVRAYRTLRAALPVDEIHYATKCNADPGVLAALHRAGCRFEIASYPELVLLRKVGVRAADVLFSNPVKPPEHTARARAAGCGASRWTVRPSSTSWPPRLRGRRCPCDWTAPRNRSARSRARASSASGWPTPPTCSSTPRAGACGGTASPSRSARR